jgi:hypothetical protein
MYNREIELKNSFNEMMPKLFGVEKQDYYTKLTTEQFISLKSVLSEINNIVTLKVSSSLADWISSNFQLTSEARKVILNSISSLKPNSNGYDIRIKEPPIIAEVKCNIPINEGNEYGSQQKNGLLKDIDGLLNGKKKVGEEVKGYFKLIGIYDSPRVRDATYHFVRNLPVELKNKS